MAIDSLLDLFIGSFRLFVSLFVQLLLGRTKMLTITDVGTMLTSYLNVRIMLTLIVNVNVTVAVKDLGSISVNYMLL